VVQQSEEVIEQQLSKQLEQSVVVHPVINIINDNYI
jgi:hypothetical protein